MKHAAQIISNGLLSTVVSATFAQEAPLDFVMLAAQPNAEAIPVLEHFLRKPNGAMSEALATARQALAERPSAWGLIFLDGSKLFSIRTRRKLMAR